MDNDETMTTMHDDSGPGLEPDARDDSQLALEPDSEEAGQRDANSHTTGDPTPEEMPDRDIPENGSEAARDESELPDSTDSTNEVEMAADPSAQAAPEGSAPGAEPGAAAGTEAREPERPEAGRRQKEAPPSRGQPMREKAKKTKAASGKKRGPKGKFNRELFEKVADRVRAGQKDTPAIQAEGMGRSAFYAQMAKDKELKQRLREARQGHELDLAEEAMFQRAVEGILKPVIRNGKVVGERRVYSDACLKALLEEYLPEKYGKPRKEKGRPLESREQREQRRAQEIATVHEHNEWDKKNARHAAADYLRACLEEGDDPGQWVYDFQAAEAAKDAGNLAEAAAKEASAVAASGAVWRRPQSRDRTASQNAPASASPATGLWSGNAGQRRCREHEPGGRRQSPNTGQHPAPESLGRRRRGGPPQGRHRPLKYRDSTRVQTTTTAPSATAATSAPGNPQLPDRVALAAAQEKAQRLEDELFRRAIDGYEQPVFGPEGEIGTVLAHSNRLLVFLFQSWRRRSPMAGKSAAQFEFEIEEREHKAQVHAIKQIGDIYGLPCQMIGRRFMAKHWHNIPAQNRTPVENPFPEV